MRTIEKRNFIAAGFFIALGAFAIYLTVTTFVRAGANTGGPLADTAFYPQLISGLMIFLAILLVISTLRKKATGDTSEETEEEQREREMSPMERQAQKDRLTRGAQIVVALVLIGYTYFVELLGYLILTPIVMVILFRLLKVKSWIMTIVLAVGSTGILYLFFAVLLDVIFPYGRLF